MYNVCVPIVPCLIGGSLLYNTGLVSTIHQCESAKGIHTSPLSRTSLALHTPSHPLDLHRAPHVSSLGRPPVSQWLSVLLMAMYVSTLLSQFIPPSSSLLFPQACSLCLQLYYCPANRFIGTIFLVSICMR